MEGCVRECAVRERGAAVAVAVDPAAPLGASVVFKCATCHRWVAVVVVVHPAATGGIVARKCTVCQRNANAGKVVHPAAVVGGNVARRWNHFWKTGV